MIFKENFEAFEKNGLTTIPLNGKIPLVSNWQKKILDPYDLSDQFPHANIGMVMGHPLVAIDFDIEDKNIIRDLIEILKRYDSPWVRAGRPTRLPTYFFRAPSSEPLNKKILGGKVEFLGHGRQCVLPPSIHPDTKKPYKWLSKNIWASFDAIPEFQNSMWEEIASLAKDETTISLLGTEGRHNFLTKTCFAMIERGEDATTIISELLRVDLEEHKDNPYFRDNTEAHGGQGYASALAMYFSCFKTSKNKSTLPIDPIQVEIKEAPVKKRTRIKLRKMRGMMQEFFSHCYQSSHTPRSRTSQCAAISLMGTILGNRVHFNGTYTNTYALMVMPSGFGKDRPLKYPKRVLASTRNLKLIGHSEPSSDTGIIKTLGDQPVRIDTIDEASKLFGGALQGKNHSHIFQKVIDIYAQLWSMPGQMFEGKSLAQFNKPIGQCFSPHVSIIAAMTPSAFENSITEHLVATGLGARFLYFFDDKEKNPNFEFEDRKEIPEDIKKFINFWINRRPEVFNIDRPEDTATEMSIVPQAKSYLIDCKKHLHKMAMSQDADWKRAIYNRAQEFLIKLSMFDRIGEHDCKGQEIPPLLKSNIQWAMEWLDSYQLIVDDFFERHPFAGSISWEMKLILDAFKGVDSLSKSDLSQKVGKKLNKRKRHEIIESLADSGHIVIWKDNQTTMLSLA